MSDADRIEAALRRLTGGYQRQVQVDLQPWWKDKTDAEQEE